MNRVNYTGDDETQTAIAAAAYVIASLEESSLNKNKPVEALRTSDKPTIVPTDSRKTFRWLTGRTSPSVEYKPTDDNGNMKKAVDTIPAYTKNPTFIDKKFGSKRENSPAPKAPSTIQPTTSLFSFKKRDENSVGSSKAGVKADDWENAQLNKIKNWYEKKKSKILEWETTKKTKAKRQMEKKEGKIEERRAIGLHEYRSEISRINEVAGKARTAADERRRKDESKLKEKAKMIR